MFRFLRARNAVPAKQMSNAEYWTHHNVTNHRKYQSREESLDYLEWRNAQYLFYDSLLPCAGHDGKTVLDYGCGPGNDLVGFVEFSRPKRVVGADIAPTALDEARDRLALHSAEMVELRLVHDAQKTLPFEDASFDYIHSSGVLQCTPNIDEILAEFHRILKPTGLVRIMVYNHDSIWLHLYVPYQRQMLQRIDSGLGLHEAFKRSTDGEACPISRCYRKEEFLALCSKHGFKVRFLGAAISIFEMSLLHLRFEAMQNIALAKEHRRFLKELEFDAYGRPLHSGEVAGIDAVFELTK